MRRENERVVLVATVGNTKDPVEKAINENSPDVVFLAYGRPFPSQVPSPLDVVTELRNELVKRGVEVHTVEISEPEDLEKSMLKFYEIVRKVNEYSENSKIVVDITGGTKIMSATALHSFLTSFFGEFQIEYIGGSERDEGGKVKKYAMRGKIVPSYKSRLLEIIRAVENYEFHIAAKLSEKFPDTSEGRFLKNATLSLLLWDNFEYERAFQKIRGEIYNLAKIYREENRYGRLPEIVIKLVKNAQRIINSVKTLTGAENGEKAKINSEDALLLLAEILANAERRLHASNFAECVLRSYRAVEAAFQIKLLELGINPWKPQGIEKFVEPEKFLKETSLSKMPDKFSLNHCFIFMKLVKPEFEKIEEDLRYLQQIRNYSFLEHGYASVSREKAEKCLSRAKKMVSKIMKENIESVIEEVRI